jgi:hypothetical protein
MAALQLGEASGEFPAGLEALDVRRLAPPRGEQAGLVALVSVDCLHGKEISPTDSPRLHYM